MTCVSLSRRYAIGVASEISSILFWSGNGDKEGNFFLCQRYSVDPEDDWPASFRVDGKKNEGIVPGPILNKYLDYNPECEFNDVDSCIATAHGFAYLLAILGETIDCRKYSRLPVAFAEHDGTSTIYINS